MSKAIHIHFHDHGRFAARGGVSRDREPDQSDINAAASGLRMTGKSVSELEDIMRQHEGKEMFASKAIYLAAKQMKAAKLRMGARRE